MDIKKGRYEVVDFFAQIAGGGKRLNTRIPPLSPISPLDISHVELPTTEKMDVVFNEFDEKKEYENNQFSFASRKAWQVTPQFNNLHECLFCCM